MPNRFSDQDECKPDDHTVIWFMLMGIVVTALLPFVI